MVKDFAPESRPRKRWRRRLVVFSIVVVLTGLVISGIRINRIVQRLLQDVEEAELHRSQVVCDTQLAKLAAGESQGLLLYDTSGTDSLLKKLAGNPHVEQLCIKQTDATDDGIRHLGSLPNLRSLVLYGAFGNESIEHLSAAKQIENLQLVNTYITDDGIRALSRFPQLRYLTVFNDRSDRVSSMGLSEFENFTALETLDLTGGWAQKAEIEYLRNTLPNVKVNQTDHTHAGNYGCRAMASQN